MITKLITKKELLLIFIFLFVIFFLTYSSIIYSRMRERDLSRQRDLAAIQNALNVFQSNYSFYPPSVGGKIQACPQSESDFRLGIEAVKSIENPYEFFALNASGCDFGKDYFLSDLADANTKILNPIPTDPLPNRSFYYLSNGESFAILSDMETTTVEDYDGKPQELGIKCGAGVCDYAKGNMILDNLP